MTPLSLLEPLNPLALMLGLAVVAFVAWELTGPAERSLAHGDTAPCTMPPPSALASATPDRAPRRVRR